MSRWEFMRRLEELLFDIAPAEREEALQYYNDYFNDAGKENEQEVINALGSPEQVAKIVKDGLSDNIAQGEYTETGFQSGENVQNAIINHSKQNQQSEKEQDKAEDQNTYSSQSGQKGQDGEKGGLPTWAIVLIVIAAVICSPVILGAAFSILGTVFGIICAIFGIVVGFMAATIALCAAAIGLIVAGFGMMFTSPLISLGLIGAGLICAALGILFLLLAVLLAGKGIPAMCKGISYLYRKIVDKKGGAQA